MSIAVVSLTFRWADDQLIVTTPKGQHHLNASEVAQLLDFLYAQKDEIFDAEAHVEGLATLVRQHPQQQFVIGNLNPQSEPVAPAPLPLGEGRRKDHNFATSGT